MSVRCLCIDDKNRPIDFPEPSKWVKEGNQYTIVNLKFVELSNTHGVQLEEIDLSDCFPYLFFEHKRFVVRLEDKEELEQLIKDSFNKPDSEIDEIDIQEYVEKITLVPEFD